MAHFKITIFKSQAQINRLSIKKKKEEAAFINYYSKKYYIYYIFIS
jgi:hypothetical protein